jgi:citrate synthase
MTDSGKKVTIEIEGQKYEFPLLVGTENEKAIDIRKLRKQTGIVTIDSGFQNTASTESAVTYLDGENGILRYRGVPIEELAENSNFVETSYLLLKGSLPNKNELETFTDQLTKHTIIHEDLRRLYTHFPKDAHPMSILSSFINALSAYYSDFDDPENPEHRMEAAIRLLAKLPTVAAFSYKKNIGQPVMYPRNSLSYVANFMYMMFAVPSEQYVVVPEVERALNLLLILHADHEQNCSTTTVRLVGSSRASLFSCISAGINALWGPLHGGANQAVIEMLRQINEDGGDVDKYVKLAKDKDSSFRLMGFGHRVYKNFDPRAKIIKKACDSVLNALGIHDPLLEIAKRLEEVALSDDYFVERKLYPNVDFYSGIIYRAIGIPTNMFTVMFALGRLPGWIAHWMEMLERNEKIGRPRQIYTGANATRYVPIAER